jgi:hypothetical protein
VWAKVGVVLPGFWVSLENTGKSAGNGGACGVGMPGSIESATAVFHTQLTPDVDFVVERKGRTSDRKTGILPTAFKKIKTICFFICDLALSLPVNSIFCF